MPSQPAPPRRPAAAAVSRSSALVGAGILLSRLAGMVRTSLIAAFLGQRSMAADTFNAALRIPNFIQNLFGEGSLSASFIPVYAGLLGAGRRDDADRLARAVFTILALVTAVLVVIGVAGAPWLAAGIARGFTGEKRELTIALVRIIFPGIGLLVMSAWCLAILNSHGKFFLSYAAPVAWNCAIIAAVIVFHGRDLDRLAMDLAWAAVAGSALQFLLQAPTAWRLVHHPDGARAEALRGHVRTVAANFVPVALSRGVVQVSAIIDTFLASYLPEGAVSALSNAQLLYTLPVSLFGMSISAAELPAMSSALGATGLIESMRVRIEMSQRAIAALVIPSAIAFVALGDVIASVIFEHHRFTHADSVWVWSILAGSAVGLLSSTIARLYAAGFWALGDTRTPVVFAAIRVAVVTALGYALALPTPRLLGIDQRWGAAGLTLSAGIAGWIEFVLLRRALQRRIGAIHLDGRFLAAAWGVAIAAAAPATALRWLIPAWPTMIRGVIILAVYGLVFLAAANRANVLSFAELRQRFGGRRGGKTPPRA